VTRARLLLSPCGTGARSGLSPGSGSRLRLASRGVPQCRPMGAAPRGEQLPAGESSSRPPLASMAVHGPGPVVPKGAALWAPDPARSPQSRAARLRARLSPEAHAQSDDVCAQQRADQVRRASGFSPRARPARRGAGGSYSLPQAAARRAGNVGRTVRGSIARSEPQARARSGRKPRASAGAAGGVQDPSPRRSLRALPAARIPRPAASRPGWR
jgi:hypothetical protein